MPAPPLSVRLAEAPIFGATCVSFIAVPYIPIFDTSAIINLAQRDASDEIWPRLRKRLPARGCPLSFVTVLELLDGLSRGGAEHFDESIKALNLASQLSRRRVLLLSIPFVHRELFGVKSPGAERSKENVKRFLATAQRPTFKNDFLVGKTAFLDKIQPLIVMTRRGYIKMFEDFLDAKFPDFDWRSERKKAGHPLPETDKENLKRQDFGEWKRDYARRMVAQIETRAVLDPANVISDRCDGYLTHSVSVIRDTLISGYRFEENPNDFHDGMQLLYLAREAYCLVTDDASLIRRVNKSTQRERILSVNEFVTA